MLRIPPLLSFSDTARDRTTGCRPGIRHDESEFLFRVDNYEIGDKRHRTRECDAKGSCAIGVQGLIALSFLFSLKNAPACTFGSGAVWYARDFSGLRGPLACEAIRANEAAALTECSYDCETFSGPLGVDLRRRPVHYLADKLLVDAESGDALLRRLNVRWLFWDRRNPPSGAILAREKVGESTILSDLRP